MRLLPRPEAITGEVRCGRHKSQGMGSEEYCDRRANHPGPCNMKQLAYERVAYGNNPQKDERIREAYGSARRGGKTSAMFDYLREMYPDWNFDEDEARFKYDGGGFRGPPRASGQASQEWEEFRHIYGWDMAARGSVDGTSYKVAHPDTGVQIEVTKEDFNSIWKRTDGLGGYDGSNASIVQFVREVLSRYV